MYKPVYRYPRRIAKEENELEEYRESRKENIACKDDIEEAIRKGFDGCHLNGDCARELCEKHGTERVGWVLANTVQHYTWDGRYRPHNQEWADRFPIPTDAEDMTTDYDAAEGLLTASILMVAEFSPPETRHIVSVFKVIQDLLAPSGTRGKTQFQLLVNQLPEEHKARWFAGAALNTSEQAMSSVMSTALSRLNAFLDSELEQILCFDTAIDAEQFCSKKSAIFIVLPEEDTSKHFMVSLIVQQMYREILAVADENDGRLKNRVMMYLDEFGTIPKIEGAEMMFSASRSRRVSIVAIIQSFAQLQKNYGKEGCEIITDNTQLTVFGGFAPNSESAQVLSKALGSKTVQSGSVNRGKNDPSQSLQMIERALLTPDELKSLPKGTFVVMKTGFHPMQVRLKLFFKWGIVFPKEIYTVPDKGNRKVSYANKSDLEAKIVMVSSTQSVGEKMTDAERTAHTAADKKKRAESAFDPNRKPKGKVKSSTDDDDAEKGDGIPMAETNLPTGEETEILINKKGAIIDEKLRSDAPR